jgi:hypothetical protein
MGRTITSVNCHGLVLIVLWTFTDGTQYPGI